MADNIDFNMITPTSVRHGWAGEDAAKQAFDMIGDQFAKFFISGQTKSAEGVRMCLWEFSKKVNGGNHLPTYRQEIGDCVSMGASNGINYLACVEISKLGQSEKFRPTYQPYIYGISRVQIGNRSLGRGDGSVGAWAALGCQKYGTLAADEPDVPRYSGNIASDWGWNGPPQKFIEIAKPHVIRSAAKITSYEMSREAIANGYTITVASNRGFKMQPSVDRGKSWGVPSGTWEHQMAFIGVDDDRSRPGLYILNSWGQNAHGTPADDAPPGGFWVDAEVADKMFKQNDSFAFSQYEGFPEQKFDWMMV